MLWDESNRGVINYLKDFKAVAFPKTRVFPIKPKPYDE